MYVNCLCFQSWKTYFRIHSALTKTNNILHTVTRRQRWRLYGHDSEPAAIWLCVSEMLQIRIFWMSDSGMSWPSPMIPQNHIQDNGPILEFRESTETGSSISMWTVAVFYRDQVLNVLFNKQQRLNRILYLLHAKVKSRRHSVCFDV